MSLPFARSLHYLIRDEVALRPSWWRLFRRVRQHKPIPGPIHRVLSTFAKERDSVRFVQVGSNDASYGDSIMEYVLANGWQGVLVEPVPYVFERLKRRHGRNPRFKLENVAIGQREGELPFYCLEPMEHPPTPYYDQMGSFSREHIEKHERFQPGLSQHIREIKVRCITLTSLLKQHGLNRLDLLHVDAEGYDFDVLQSLDFGWCTPRMVLFESGHLPPAQRVQCEAFLLARGYRVVYEGRDCLALHDGQRGDCPQTARMFDIYSPEA